MFGMYAAQPYRLVCERLPNVEVWSMPGPMVKGEAQGYRLGIPVCPALSVSVMVCTAMCAFSYPGGTRSNGGVRFLRWAKDASYSAALPLQQAYLYRRTSGCLLLPCIAARRTVVQLLNELAARTAGLDRLCFWRES